MYKAERIGTHVILDMVGVDFILLDEMDGFVKWMDGTLWDYECDVLGVQKHKFKPQGFTAVYMLAESHFSIHTWPEKGIAACDIFTCGDVSPESIANEVIKWFRPVNFDMKKITR
jgi:S-adenosylmethionine decarboxylase